MENVDYAALIVQGSISAFILSLMELWYFYNILTKDITKSLEDETKIIVKKVNNEIKDLDNSSKQMLYTYLNSTLDYLSHAKETPEQIKEHNENGLKTGISISVLIFFIGFIAFLFTQNKMELFSITNLLNYICIIIAFIVFQLHFSENIAKQFKTVSTYELQYEVMKELIPIVEDIEKNSTSSCQ